MIGVVMVVAAASAVGVSLLSSLCLGDTLVVSVVVTMTVSAAASTAVPVSAARVAGMVATQLAGQS